MASEVPQLSENVDSPEYRKVRKNLRSAFVTENDPLTIKLKITKRDVKPSKCKTGESSEMKNSRNHRIIKPDEGCRKDIYDQPMKGNTDDYKRKARVRRESDDEVDHFREDSMEEVDSGGKKGYKYIDDSLNESVDLSNKPAKRRGRPSRVQAEENRKREEKKRLKRLETGADGEKSISKIEISKESFCWTCHKDGSVVKCDTCPRVFHLKCVSLSKDPSKDWICPECSLVLHAENMSTRSEAMKNLSLDQLCTLLNFAISRMKKVPESQAFWKPVDPKEVPFYDKYVMNPMDLNLLEKNTKAKMYGSPQAFLADAKWLLHNSVIFNSTQSSLTNTAKFLVKICKQEMAEIENCPDCYLNAHTKKEWFVEVCRKPHILIWARLKGFPFWPAKAMSTNLKNQSVDARFFGAHDKAWVPIKECYLYSKNSPQAINKKRAELDGAFAEAEAYIKKIKQKYGTFCYAPDKTPFSPEIYDKQLQSMIPSYQEEKMKKKKSKLPAEECETSEVILNTSGKLNEKDPVKLNDSDIVDSSKVPDAACFVNDYVTDEKSLGGDKVSPEDEVARTLEMYDTVVGVNRDVVDENSTDMEEDGSVPIPEHGYSRCVDAELNPITDKEIKNQTVQVEEKVLNTGQREKESEKECHVDESHSVKHEIENDEVSIDDTHMEETISATVEKSTPDKIQECQLQILQSSSTKENTSQHCTTTAPVPCEISADSVENKRNSRIPEDNSLSKKVTKKRKSSEKTEEEPPKKVSVNNPPEPSESSKKDNCQSGNNSSLSRTVDDKQNILEANLLECTDARTLATNKKVVTELGLGATAVGVGQQTGENCNMNDALNKNGHEKINFEDIPIKNEDFEQYLIEESHQDIEVSETEMEDDPLPTQLIKVRDIQTLSNNCSPAQSVKSDSELVPTITEVRSLKEKKSNKECKKKKSEDSCSVNKLKLEPVVQLIKLDTNDKSIQQLNKKLRLSDEVSVMMVDSDKNSSKSEKACVSSNVLKKRVRTQRDRKNTPNRTDKSSFKSVCPVKTPPANVSVISVDTENSSAQKNLLKSLCSDDKKPDDSANKTNRKTVVITTSDTGIKNVDVTTEEVSASKSSDMEGVPEKTAQIDATSSGQQKNMALVGNSHLILTNNCSTVMTNQNNQSNLALAQNNMGQLNLIQLTNVAGGIQTNMVRLTNDGMGLNNPIAAIYAAPNFNSDASAGNRSVLLTASPTTNVTCGKSAKASERRKPIAPKVPPPVRQGSGISVRSPASLGLTTTASSKVPPVTTKNGDEPFEEAGSVTAELNRHSIKMAEQMRTIFEDMLKELSNKGSLEAKYIALTFEMEKLHWSHKQEIMELKQNSERSLMELRKTLESEKQKSLAELKSQLEAKHQRILNETKNKQWCANCGKEALFYCCWNTSYCDYPCQQQHWPGHMSRCAQLRNNVQVSNQMQNDNLTYQSTTYVPLISPHSTGTITINRPIVAQTQIQGKPTEPPAPQLPFNITIQPQHYYM